MNADGRFFHRLLVPVDGSDSSLKAAWYALQMARREGCEVRVVHVIDELIAEELARFADRPIEAVLERMRQSGRSYIEEVLRRGEEHGVAVEGEIRVGVPHQLVGEVAAECECDLIVIGKVGRRGPRRVLIGSVTERVIEQSTVPVLVVK